MASFDCRLYADTTWNNGRWGALWTNFFVKSKSIPSQSHRVIIPAQYAVVTILIPLQSLPPQWELERERESASSSCDLRWTSLSVILNWMGRISSLLIDQAVMVKQQCVLWQLRLSPVISTEGQRAGCHAPSFTQPWCKGGRTLRHYRSLMLLICKWEVRAPTGVAPFS